MRRFFSHPTRPRMPMDKGLEGIARRCVGYFAIQSLKVYVRWGNHATTRFISNLNMVLVRLPWIYIRSIFKKYIIIKSMIVANGKIYLSLRQECT